MHGGYLALGWFCVRIVYRQILGVYIVFCRGLALGTDRGLGLWGGYMVWSVLLKWSSIVVHGAPIIGCRWPCVWTNSTWLNSRGPENDCYRPKTAWSGRRPWALWAEFWELSCFVVLPFPSHFYLKKNGRQYTCIMGIFSRVCQLRTCSVQYGILLEERRHVDGKNVAKRLSAGVRAQCSYASRALLPCAVLTGLLCVVAFSQSPCT